MDRRQLDIMKEMYEDLCRALHLSMSTPIFSRYRKVLQDLDISLGGSREKGGWDWISVKDKMPPPGVEVLTIDEEYTVRVDKYYGRVWMSTNNLYSYFLGSSGFVAPEIQYWAYINYPKEVNE